MIGKASSIGLVPWDMDQKEGYYNEMKDLENKLIPDEESSNSKKKRQQKKDYFKKINPDLTQSGCCGICSIVEVLFKVSSKVLWIYTKSMTEAEIYKDKER